MTTYTIDLKELVSRPIIRHDYDYEWLNKMTDDEIERFYQEVMQQNPTRWITECIDQNILYQLHKVENEI
jgi:hypothetical protein